MFSSRHFSDAVKTTDNVYVQHQNIRILESWTSHVNEFIETTQEFKLKKVDGKAMTRNRIPHHAPDTKLERNTHN